MKKVFSILIIFLLLGFINVNAAACKSGELTKLNEAANKVKVGYDVIETKKTFKKAVLPPNEPTDETEEIVVDEIKIIVYGVSDDIFIIMTNDNNDEEVVINSENSPNGNYSFIVDDILNIINYKYEIYSNTDSCDTTLLKTISFEKPKFNQNAHYQICIDNPTVPVCQRYITKDFDLTNAELEEYIEKYLKGDIKDNNSNTNTEENINSFIKNNKLYIIGGASVIIVSAIIISVVVSKKRGAL